MRLRTFTTLVLTTLVLAACGKSPSEAATGDDTAPAGGAPAAGAPAAGAPKAATGLTTAQLGDYECWAHGSARLLLNFSVTGPGTYTASDGTDGTFAIGDDGVATFTGYQAEVMPSNFTIMYHTPDGHPTFSFRGPSGEAAFCEHAGS